MITAVLCFPAPQVFHNVYIAVLQDGISLAKTYVVAEADVSHIVQAERRVQKLQRQQQNLLRQILPQQVGERAAHAVPTA